MARWKSLDAAQAVLAPLCLNDVLEPGGFEFAVHHLIEARYDESFLAEAFDNDLTGAPAWPPKVLLKVLLICYARGVLSSRRIEAACATSVPLMLLCACARPDHATIARFVLRLGPRLPALFAEVLQVCHEEGLLEGTRFALDGLKLPANASKDMSGTFAELQRKRDKLEAKAKELMAEHQTQDKGGAPPAGDVAQNARRERIERLVSKAEKISTFLQDNAPREGIAAREIKSNLTDPDSTKMGTSHGTIQGYNAQALVDARHQIVLHPQAISEGQDSAALASVLSAANTTAAAAGLGPEYLKTKQLLADSGYHSERNLEAAEAHGMDAYVPDNHFRSRDPKLEGRDVHLEQAYGAKKSLFTIADFKHDPVSDTYQCPAGQMLTLNAAVAKTGKGHTYRRYLAQKAACANCALRTKCLTARGKVRSLYAAAAGTHKKRTQLMREKIDLPASRAIYSKRMGIVEPVFANIRHNKGVTRFWHRGRQKVNWVWTLHCLVHNLGKLAVNATAYFAGLAVKVAAKA
jgi:transposase